MAVAELEQLRESSDVIPLISADLVLPEDKVLIREGNLWVVRNAGGEMVGLGGDTEGALMAAYGLTRGGTIEHAWRASESIPIESLDAFTNPTFGDLYSDLSDDQLKLADIVLDLDILNEAENPNEYAPDQVLISKDGRETPIFRVDHAISKDVGMSIFFRKEEGENGELKYTKLGACSADRRPDAMRLFGKFGYFLEEIPEVEQETLLIEPEEAVPQAESVEQATNQPPMAEVILITRRMKREEIRARRRLIDRETFVRHLLGEDVRDRRFDPEYPIAQRPKIASKKVKPAAGGERAQMPRIEPNKGKTTLVPGRTFSWLPEDYEAPVETIEAGGEVIDSIDLSRIGPFREYRKKLNGSTPKTDRLLRTSLEDEIRLGGSVPALLVFTPTTDSCGPLFAVTDEGGNESRKVGIVRTGLSRDRKVYVVARSAYVDVRNIAQKLEFAAYQASSRLH